MVNQYNICTTSGDTYEINIVYRDSDKVPIDLTGYTLYFQVRQSKCDCDIVFDKTITIPSEEGEQGIIKFTLTSSETELLSDDETAVKYVYGMRLTNVDKTDVKTILSGTLEVIKGVI